MPKLTTNKNRRSRTWKADLDKWDFVTWAWWWCPCHIHSQLQLNKLSSRANLTNLVFFFLVTFGYLLRCIYYIIKQKREFLSFFGMIYERNPFALKDHFHLIHLSHENTTSTQQLSVPLFHGSNSAAVDHPSYGCLPCSVTWVRFDPLDFAFLSFGFSSG